VAQFRARRTIHAVIAHRRHLGWAVEAVAALSLASLAVRFVPFRRIVAWVEALAALPLRVDLASPDRRAVRARVRWAVVASAERLPWRPVCFPQGLAAFWMLRRRGVPCTFYYGAQPSDQKGVEAHVWICDGDIPIVGGEAAPGMKVLLRIA